jgi:hypothetical protein
MSRTSLGLGLAWLLIAGAPASADYLITFVSGGKLRVDSYRREHGWFLIPTQGGEIGVPESEVAALQPMAQVDGSAPLAAVQPAAAGGSAAAAISAPAAQPGARIGSRLGPLAGEGGDNPLRSLLDRLKESRGGAAVDEGEGRGDAGGPQAEAMKARIERLREMANSANDQGMRDRFSRMAESLEQQGPATPEQAISPYRPQPGGRIRRGPNGATQQGAAAAGQDQQ